MDGVAVTTEADEVMEKSEDIASVTECIPVVCVAKAYRNPISTARYQRFLIDGGTRSPTVSMRGWGAAGGIRLTDGRTS